MAASNLRYLVATPCGLFLVHKGRYKKVFKDSCFGVSWSEDFLFVCQRSGDRKLTDTVAILNKKFKVEATYPTKIHGVHQAYYDPETSMLYIVNTYRGRIERMRTSGVFAKPYTWGFARKWNDKKGYKNHKNNHLNSIWKQDGNFWVVEHNYQFPSNIKCVDVGFTKVLDNVHVGSQLHNVAIVGDFMYFCHSPKSMIRRYNMQKRRGARAKELVYKGDCKYTRGLAISKDRILVGSSTHCPRVVRGVGSHSIHITELNHQLRVTGTTEIKKVNQCHEIRILDVPDLAHNGIVWGSL
jgi:hypothetical protein